MRIVHIEDFFHPLAGYQLNTLAPALSKMGYEVIIVTSKLNKIPSRLKDFFGVDEIEKKDREFEEKYNVKIIRVDIFTYYSGRSIYYPTIFKLVDSLKPDILFVHGEDTFIGILYALRYKKLKYPLIFDCHSVDFASRNRFSKQFRWFFKKFIGPVIVRNNIPLIRVVDVDFVEKYYGIPLYKTVYIPLFNVDTSLFYPDNTKRKHFREKFGIKNDEFVLLYAGKIDEEKGGIFLAESIKEEFCNAKRKPTFLIVSSNNDEYAKRVYDLFKESKNKIILIETQPFDYLPYVFNGADVVLYPKQCGMSFFQAQACGKMVIFENNEINKQRTVGKNAILFEKDNIFDFREKIEYVLNISDEELIQGEKEATEYIRNNFDFDTIIKKYDDLFKKVFLKFLKKESNYEYID